MYFLLFLSLVDAVFLEILLSSIEQKLPKTCGDKVEHLTWTFTRRQGGNQTGEESK